MTMTLTELNKLIEGATPAGWDVNAYNLGQVIKINKGADRDGQTFIDGRWQESIADVVSKNGLTWGERHANAALIAASRTALPNALRVIAECKRVIEEAKHALEMSPIYARKEGVWINARVKGSAMFHLKHEDERFTESFQLAGDLNNAAKVSADKALALLAAFERDVLQQEKM